MKRKQPEPENHERWLVSYADFITLLFAFFVVMFASSQTDKAKAKQMSAAVEEALSSGTSFGAQAKVAKILGGTIDDTGQGNAQMKGPGGAQRSAKEAPPEDIVELLPSMKRLTKSMEEEIKAGKVDVSLEPRGLVISLRQAVFFPSGTDALERKTYPMIEKVAKVLSQIDNPIRIEGHTDSQPIHTPRFRSNWELSAARSIAFMETLTNEFGVDGNRLAIVGYADTVAVAPNDSEEGRARNRRVDIVILNQIGMRQSEKPVAAKPGVGKPGEAKPVEAKPSVTKPSAAGPPVKEKRT